MERMQLTGDPKRDKISFPAAPRKRRSAGATLSAPEGFMSSPFFRIFVLIAAASSLALAVTPATAHRKRAHAVKKSSSTAVAVKSIAVKPASLVVSSRVAAATRKTSRTRRRAPAQTWDEPTYKDSTLGDRTEGEDPVVRQAAVAALNGMNGSIVVTDPNTGRILTIVNQQLALGGGFQPCSTIKVSVALAALREGLVSRMTPVKFYSRGSLDLTDALAYSNNYYFANLGIQLGYERESYYAHLFGYGEKAGLDIEGEHPGLFPPAPPKNGGMGMLTSFGEEIAQTPLEFAALMGAVANGGTLYWLQYPRSAEDFKDFRPQVKRHLDIANLIEEIKPGLRGAVDFGTAKRARQEDVLLGKTGTCSEGRIHLGWFGSFNDSGSRKLVVVVMLTGGAPSIGPVASGVGGDVYRRLASENFFKTATPLTPALLSPPICCSPK